jgi:hypothetical protein
MHYKQRSLPYGADPMPTLLTVDHAVFCEASDLDRRIRAMRFQNRCPRASFGLNPFFSAFPQLEGNMSLYITYNMRPEEVRDGLVRPRFSPGFLPPGFPP